jgi:hypothetical protein
VVNLEVSVEEAMLAVAALTYPKLHVAVVMDTQPATKWGWVVQLAKAAVMEVMRLVLERVSTLLLVQVVVMDNMPALSREAVL